MKEPNPHLLKWLGGKRRQAGRIADMIGRVNGVYSEPFCGGLSVYLEVARRGAFDSAVIADANERLIDLYRAVQSDPEGIHFDLCNLPKTNAPETYYEIRAEFNRAPTPALLLFLNRAGFNGLYRENKSGGYNVPVGTFRKRLPVPSLADLERCSELLQGAEIIHRGFCAESFDADVTYADPPYVPLPGSKSFVAYVKTGFGLKNQQELAALALMSPGRVLVSNSDAGRYLYPEPAWKITEVIERRSVGASAKTRKKVTEIIAVCESSDVP